MGKIDRFDFGSIVVDGKQYGYDVLILPDGIVKERRLGVVWFDSHTISKDEIENLIKAEPNIILVGTGVRGLATVSRDAIAHVQQTDVDLVALPSTQAVEKFNQLIQEGTRVAALFHVTC